jgi:hypothetical protein
MCLPLQAHPKQKKWCKTAFPLFDDIADLIEGTYATGKGVVQPGEPTSDSSKDKDDNIDPTLSQLLPSSITPASSNVAPSAPILATPVVATMTELAVSAMAASTVASTPSTDAVASSKRSRNGHWKSGSQAIDGVASSISRLADAFAADIITPSPAQKQAAIHAVEDDGDLSDEEQLRVFRVICHDTGFADTILAIRKKSTCTHFIKKELYGETDN